MNNPHQANLLKCPVCGLHDESKGFSYGMCRTCVSRGFASDLAEAIARTKAAINEARELRAIRRMSNLPDGGSIVQ